LSGWTIDTLKELLEGRITEQERALTLAREELERRLDSLNELRKEVTNDRSQFVKVDVYAPAHEELRRQRNADNEKAIVLAGQVQENSKDIASMKSSLLWLTRLIAGAILLGLIAYVFQRLTGR
jgi:hypothetical protein